MRHKMRKIHKMLLLLFLLATGLSLSASFFSYALFGAGDPFDTAGGLFRIMFTDTAYAEIQQDPRVILAQPDVSLDEYMAARGYIRDNEQQLGSLCVFTNGVSEELIMYAANRFFARWCWQEQG